MRVMASKRRLVYVVERGRVFDTDAAAEVELGELVLEAREQFGRQGVEVEGGGEFCHAANCLAVVSQSLNQICEGASVRRPAEGKAREGFSTLSFL